MKLFISSRQLNKDCSNVIHYLKLSKIPSNVTCNQTIRVHGNESWVENGCQIIFSDTNDNNRPRIKQIWSDIVDKLPVKCAFLESKNFNGCIYDFIRESDCPNIC